MRKLLAGVLMTLLASSSAFAAGHVGQCIYPKTVQAKDGNLQFKHPVFISDKPDAQASRAQLTTFSAFSVGAENGAYVQLLSVPDYDQPEPAKAAGKIVGWAKLTDFVMQDLRNCN